MQILEETQLDFSDVLIKPRRSTLSSRADVDVTREYKFKWCPYIIKGTGIMQANMGTIGTFNVTRKMLKSGLFACLHKHYDIDSLRDFYKSLNDDERKRCFLSIGIKDNGYDKFEKLYDEGLCYSVCLDVPNGYIPQVKELVIKIRQNMSKCLLMVGNVVTGDIVEDLILSGADILKCGIGGGSNCLVSDTQVITKNGIMNIQDIQEGDEVLTHTGEYHKVLSKLCYTHHHEKMNINGIDCTPEHKFLVIDKSDKEFVNEINLMDYATWVEAYNLNPKTQYIIKYISLIEFVEIKKGDIENNNQKVYDLEVEKDHSFVVGDGIIVHNCLTRKQTGVGRPQFSAIVECADAAHQVGGMICADGGITCAGDIGKAFGGGTDFVMIGGLYAGTDEADGEIIEKTYLTNEKKVIEDLISISHQNIYETKKFKMFYGMSSTYAQEKFGNGKPKYRASEGRITLVPYVGSVDDVNEEFLGGLRSTMTYIGAVKLKDIPKCCVFYKVHNQLNRMYENSTIGK